MYEDKVLILMATYNGEKFLQEQLDSILNQSHTNLEIYIHDDGSTDKTLSIIKYNQKKYKNRIKLITDKLTFKDPSKNFLHLIKYIQSSKIKFDYIALSDQDDVWDKDKIKIELEVIKKSEKEIGKIPLLIHSDLYVVNKNLSIIHASFNKFQDIKPEQNSLNRLLVRNTVTGCTMLFNKMLLEIITYQNRDFIKVHDWWIALFARIFGEIIYIDKPLVYYRQHGNNSVGAKKITILNQIRTIKSYHPAEFYHYIKQASDFYDHIKGKLPQKEKSIINNFIKIPKQNLLTKRLTIIKNKFFYKEFGKDVGVFLKI